MIKQNPFSLYDFLGYFIPGSVCFFILLNFNKILEFKNFDVFINTSKNFDTSLDSVTLFVIFSYVVGHIVSFLSSITIERYTIWKYGFPSKYILGIAQKTFWKSAKKCTDFAWRIILIILFFPLIIFDYILGSQLNFEKFFKQSVDKSLADLIVFKANKLLSKIGYEEMPDYKNNEGILNNFDFHRILYHYAYENSKNHQQKLSNYVALYGFTRTLCFIFSCLSSYFFYKYLFEIVTNYSSNLLMITLLSTTTAYILYMAFMKFYRRYSLECLMVTAIIEND
ncbi:MAG: hypothetical protein KUL74_08860 [Cloacibacterium sp.]|nr:hypothetical protein [Cloacibacterium sp.]